MKCLYIFANAPLSENYHGGASRLTQKFLALTRLNIDVHVMRLLDASRKEQILSFEQGHLPPQLTHYELAASWQDVEYQSPPFLQSRVRGILKGLFRPIYFAFPEIEILRASLLQAVETIQPDFIMTQMYPGGALLATTQHNVPWIFGHEDWLYRYGSLNWKSRGRKVPLASRFRYWVKRNAEIKVARKSNLVITASITESHELKRLGLKEVYHIPATFESVPAPSGAASPRIPLRIVHFGQLGTFSNTAGLRDYLNWVFPTLQQDWEFCVVGSYDGADPILINDLKKSGAVLLGRVDDLTTVFRPFDVAVIPFQHNAGERTKVAQLFNHSQVVVAHDQSVAGLQYVRSGENCFLLSDLAGFSSILIRLAEDHNLRMRIGLAAKATFERELTLESQLSKYYQAFSTVTNRA